ncbi:NAD(P)/FAD-dependent oxidoreductase [Streptomyces sp. NPDC048282]|uniref:NAD(P)/FAD-dependent oxidoreductase n=1 Tax=Streptomyces sp. NPDC048282 TaxID=3365528 RepID=UPI003719D5C1
MTTAPDRVVVVGAGHAGATLVARLRQGGYRGEIVLLGSETDHPYQRPPLSKAFMAGDLEQWLRPAEFYREQGIDIRLGEHVVSLDRAARQVRTASGDAIGYDVLVLATGARPRRLPVPGADLDGVITLRTLADARVLRKYLLDGRGLVVIGGGYVGLEVAAVARAHGVEVTVVEREPRVLARTASARFAEFLADRHRARGTRIVTGARLLRFTGRDGRVDGVELGDGTRVGCAAVLVGVGAAPRDELAAAAGLACDQGILVDASARTGDPSVLAIGDATRRPVTGADGAVRLESIPSATEQAGQACAAILGTAPPPPEVPWFWSDQFDLKLKIAGLVGDGHEVALRGDPAAGRFAFFHHEDQVVTAVESVGAPAAFAAGRKFIATRRRIDPLRLADAGTRLSDTVLN